MPVSVHFTRMYFTKSVKINLHKKFLSHFLKKFSEVEFNDLPTWRIICDSYKNIISLKCTNYEKSNRIFIIRRSMFNPGLQ